MTGKIFVVGTGPGSEDCMTMRAVSAIGSCDAIVGYKTYIDLIEKLIVGKEIHSSGMRREVERCQLVIDLALSGKSVGLISSGDAGVYGMAGIILEMVDKLDIPIEVEVVPGITSALSSASLAGAPLMNDFVVISLSDLMTPWSVIEHRTLKAAEGDFVICVYNPMSKTRVEQIGIFVDILLKHRQPNTPVAIIKDAMRANEVLTLTTLEKLLSHSIDMTTTLIIGNSQTVISKGKMITPRGYKI